MKNNVKFSVPKNDRGLGLRTDSLRFKNTHTGPAMYNITESELKTRIKMARAAIGKASRDISFSKYGSLHSELVAKGLY